MVFLKTLVAPFFFPLPLSLAMLLAGVVLLWGTKRQKAGKILVTAGSLLVFLFSWAPISDLILGPLEDRYHAFGQADSLLAVQSGTRYVAVLGGGNVSDPRLPPTGKLKEPSSVRLTEGIRIQRAIPGSKLILSGGAIADPQSNAEAMRDVALQLGVPDSNIILQTSPTNTHEEVVGFRERVGGAPIVVVSSAAHLPRAIAMFEKAGMHPLPAPTDQLVKRRQQTDPSRLFPMARYLLASDRAVYEWYATLLARVRGEL